ncbi:MAG: glutaminase A [Firmicutes bacterium]|nr:glutaminase A [Bacillota bacterium]
MNQEKILNVLETAYQKGKAVAPYGNVATYIPELGKADKNNLGISIFTVGGQKYNVGDTDRRFTIQSISKIISLVLALEHLGFDKVFSKVGMEPSGEAFNSLVELDLNSNKPFNPMINSGALTVSSLLLPEFSFEEMTEYARKVCLDSEIEMNEAVFQSEMSNVSRNRAIAYLLESKGIIENDVEKSLELYTKMCSLNVTAESLANFGMILAADGINPANGERLISAQAVKIAKTIMLTCGMYDGSGEFAVYVGIPTKSGVGGGLLSVADYKMGIGVYGPSLDEKGNCIAGRPVLEYLSKELGLHIFDRKRI